VVFKFIIGESECARRRSRGWKIRWWPKMRAESHIQFS
jgi:hypothetical protein